MITQLKHSDSLIGPDGRPPPAERGQRSDIPTNTRAESTSQAIKPCYSPGGSYVTTAKATSFLSSLLTRRAA